MNILKHTTRLATFCIMLLPLHPLIADSGAGASAGGSEPTTESDSTPSFEVADETDVRLIYSVNRVPEPLFDAARAVQVITRADLWRRGARTLPEVLMEEAGLFVQQTNYGGGAPIIRGLIGKQILILIDGVRLNNAVYRFGPIQYLNTIDLNAVERIEVVRGAGSVLGSDALGGVINVITRSGPTAAEGEGFRGAFYSRYSTADEGFTGRIEASGRTERYRYIAGATLRNSNDLEAGDRVGLQAGTGYDENAIDLGFEYFIDTERTFSASYLGLQQDDVPRTDRIASGRNLVFDFDPQRLQVLELTYKETVDRPWADSLQATLYWNRQEEDRQEILSSAPSTERRLSDGQTTLGFNLELQSFLGKSHRLVYGLDYSTDDIDSTREDIDLATGLSRPRRGQFTDGSSYDILAAYVQDRFDVADRLTLTLGARYSRFSASGQEDTAVGTLDLNSSDDSLTGSASLVFHATDKLNLIAQTTRGFRAPNLDDISIFDERPEGTEVPNQNLRPEEVTTYELGLKYSSARFSGSAFYYTSELSDLLVRAPGTVGGLPFFDMDGDGVQDPGEANVLQKQNIGQATVEGFEVDWSFVPVRSLRIFGNYTTTRGDDDRADVPLQRIPPSYGILGLRWSGRTGQRPWAELVLQHADAQRRLNPDDVSDSRIGPDGTEGFDIVHLRGGLWLTERLRGSLAVENLFDELYKYHASGVFRPGRQAVAQLELRF